MSALSLSLHAVGGIPLVKTGDKLSTLLYDCLVKDRLELEDNDVLVIAQKIVSKAEGRVINLETVEPGSEARQLAKKADKDPRLVELILSESTRLVRCKPGVIIVEHHSGIVMANAGIDHSNVEQDAEKQYVTLLPENADLSARQLRNEFEELSGRKLAVVINDSVGRAWRLGTVGIAIGSSGLIPLRDLRGEADLFGAELAVSETADADALASAACLLMGEAAEASPLVIIRGYPFLAGETGSSSLIRLAEEDMFR